MALPVVSSNSPTAGSISWTSSVLTYAGKSYPIQAGNTAAKYVYWKFQGSVEGTVDPQTNTLTGGSSNLQAVNTLPDPFLPEDQILFLNKGGIGVYAGNTNIVDGSIIVTGSILADAIGANQITTAKIATDAVTADKILAANITSAKIAANAINANHISAGAVTANSLSVGAYTSNLAPNNYFEDWPVANAMPDKWFLSGASGFEGATVTRETSALAGSISVGLTAASGKQAAIFTSPVPCVAGNDIYLGVYYRGTTSITNGVLVGLYFLNSAGAIIATQSTAKDIVANTTDLVQHTGIAPAGAVNMQALIITSSTSKILLDNVEMAYRVTSTKITTNGVTTNNLDANAITAKHTITGATLQTSAAANTGVKINSSGISAYNASSTLVTAIDATTGALNTAGPVVTGGTITGALYRTDTTGKRIEIDGPNDIIRFFSGLANENIFGYIDSEAYIDSLDGNGVRPSLSIAPSSTSTVPQRPVIELRSGTTTNSSYALTGNGGSRLNLTADSLAIKANTATSASGQAYGTGAITIRGKRVKISASSETSVDSYIDIDTSSTTDGMYLSVGNNADVTVNPACSFNANLKNGYVGAGTFRDSVDARVNTIAPTVTMTTGSVGTGNFRQTVKNLHLAYIDASSTTVLTPGNSTETFVTWDNNVISAGFTTGDRQTFTAQIAGYYQINASYGWNGSGSTAATGIRSTRLRVNGTAVKFANVPAISGQVASVLVSSVIRLNVNDTIGVSILQNSGGTLTTSGSVTVNFFNVALSVPL